MGPCISNLCCSRVNCTLKNSGMCRIGWTLWLPPSLPSFLPSFLPPSLPPFLPLSLPPSLPSSLSFCGCLRHNLLKGLFPSCLETGQGGMVGRTGYCWVSRYLQQGSACRLYEKLFSLLFLIFTPNHHCDWLCVCLRGRETETERHREWETETERQMGREREREREILSDQESTTVQKCLGTTLLWIFVERHGAFCRDLALPRIGFNYSFLSGVADHQWEGCVSALSWMLPYFTWINSETREQFSV